ncbi:MAG: hypothetical protein K5871_06625 [Lachnospiraceae bacterium]|nr:hypothetical protein [Lachnospiraceae bacterium]
MVKVEKYIRISFTALAIFACYMMTFVSFPGFEIYNKLKYVMMIFVFAYIAYHYRDLKCPWISGAEKVVFLAYVVLSFIASIRNLSEVVTRDPLIQCIGHCGILIANFLLMVILCNTKRLKVLGEIYVKLSIILLIVTDVTILMGVTFGGNYLIGNKFGVAYHHIRTLLIFLIYVKEWDFRNKVTLVLMLIATYLINTRTDCATGIIGTLFVLFLLLLFTRQINIVLHPICQVPILYACTMFPIWYKPMMDMKVIRFIIEDILHRKMNLTGRTRIYSRIPEIFGDHILWGDGINTNVEICGRWGFSNIQNGMLKVMMESGLIAAIMVFILYFLIFHRAKHHDGRIERALSSYLLLMTVLSTVEITISVSTLAVLMCLCVLTGYEKETETAEKKDTE